MLTCSLDGLSVSGEGEGERVRCRLRIFDSTETVLDPEADGIVQVGQVVREVPGSLALVVEALDPARGLEKVLQASARC